MKENNARWKFGLHIEMKVMEAGNICITIKDTFSFKNLF